MVKRWAVAVLFLALISVAAPAYSHTTIGNLNGSAPLFRSNDHELNPTNTFGRAHVPGPLGHVWPGGGLNTYAGVSAYPPGYQSPFTTFEQPLQAGANSYAPEGAILTSTADHDTVGDMIFAVNFSQPSKIGEGGSTTFSYSSIVIYLPAPAFDRTGEMIQDGFEPAGDVDWDSGKNTNIVTTITDSYGNIFVTRADKNDPFAPDSWMIFISSATGINFTSTRNYREWYYIRINQMKAPFVAGRYFFKMFMSSDYAVCSQSYQSEQPHYVNSTMPMENWPVLLVKGEVDPGILSGTVRYGDVANTALYGRPLDLPGKIRAVGFATNPVTGELTGRAVEARGYFNASACGHFEVEGVASGVYDVYASGAGYAEQKVAEGVKIFRGQSLTLDAYLKAGPEVRGVVFSKDKFGLSSWPSARPMSIVIYDSDVYDSDSIVAHSPINLTHAPYISHVSGNVIYDSATGYTSLKSPNVPREVAFPWEGPITLPSVSWVTGGSASNPGGGPKDYFGLFNGVGPGQYWWIDPSGTFTNGGGSTSFHYQFGIKGYYGVPTKFSGMIPQVFATWTDSLTPGKYYVRAYLNGYVQTSNNGAKLEDYWFVVPDSEFPRDVSIPLDLWKSPTINITVHFHDLPGTINSAPIRGPDPRRFLIAEAMASDESLAALNFTQVPASADHWNISLNGLGMIGPMENDIPLVGLSRVGVKYSLARYRALYDYGLPTDTYTIRLFMRGYIHALPPASSIQELDQPLSVSIAIGAGVTSVSTHMYRGCGINMTAFSVDWQRPHVDRKWVWDKASVSARIYDVASSKFVDVIYFWNANLAKWDLPKQNLGFYSLPYSSWKADFGSGASYLLTNGSTFVDRYGPDIQISTSDFPTQDMATAVFYQENFHSGFLYSSLAYRDDAYRSSLAVYPGIYAVTVGTYGYVQENVVGPGMDLGNVYVSLGSLGSMADTNVKVMIGVNFTLTILFKKENIFSGIPYNSSVRISVFDESDTLIAAATPSSNGGTLPSRTGLFADGKQVLKKAIPAGTRVLECNMSGLLGYVEPGGDSLKAATLSPTDQGIWGYSTYAGSYTGSWLVMVDLVNWYMPTDFYPPVPSLLQGEYSFFFPYNHLGPYYQQTFARIPNARLGGEASIVFELDLRGYVQGIVHGPDWNDATRTISWASIEFHSGETVYRWYTWDGWFDGYLNPGNYEVTITEWTVGNEGHNSYSFKMNVSPGQVNRAFTIVLNLTGIPIPEFTLAPIAIASLGTLLTLTGYRWAVKRKGDS